ncbi:ensconsin isoform X2 [Salmo trutta]|uniref:ensconsin isoform X2 n=1 Tax=Salmo trutta TaxID=8032 RepID=UPI0011321697|nr:ensconsin-like isoform X2 [Salmo trutta]
MAVIQKKEHRETPSKKIAPQENRKGLSTRDTQDKQKKESRAGRQGEKGNEDIKPNNSEKRRAVICVPASIKSAVISNNTTSPVNAAGPQALKVDDRLRLAKERREEHENQLVSRELGWLAREERARRLYEQQLEVRKRRLQEQREKEEKRRTALKRREELKKQLVSRELGRLAREERARRLHEQHLEERKRRLQEQREKEERRRTAVEEKRRQRMKEETERYESVVKTTLEKCQRAKQRLSQGSRGRKTNNKRVPRSSPLTAWERALVCRLLTPTCSYLARRRSHSCQSREEEVVHVCPRSASCHSIPATATNCHKSPHRSGTPDHHRVEAGLQADYRSGTPDHHRVQAGLQADYRSGTPDHHRVQAGLQADYRSGTPDHHRVQAGLQTDYRSGTPDHHWVEAGLQADYRSGTPDHHRVEAGLQADYRSGTPNHHRVEAGLQADYRSGTPDHHRVQAGLQADYRSGTPDHHRAQSDFQANLRADYRSIIWANYQLKAAQQKESERTFRRNRQQPHIPNVPVKVLPTNPQSRDSVPSPERKSVIRHKPVIRQPPSQQLGLELYPVPEEDGPPVSNQTLSPGNSRPSQTISPWAPVPNQTLCPGNSRPSQTISPWAPVPNQTLSPGNSRPSQTISPWAPVPNQTLSPGNSRPSQTISPCAPVPNHTLSPGNSQPIRISAAAWDQVQPFLGSAEPQTVPTPRTEGDTGESEHLKMQGPLPGAPSCPRPSAGTMDPEEASCLLAEKRREARLKREREEECLSREEVERRGREELERRRAEERARLEAEAQWLVEERREEEEQRHAEEERAIRTTQEAALLQKQREEEEAQARDKAEQQRLQREKHFQKEEEQRQERKKRLELIMRRTRKTSTEDKKKPVLNGKSNRNSSPGEAQPKKNTEPVKNGNGTLEEVINLGVGTGTKPSNLGLSGVEDNMVPVVAFKERRSLLTLTGMEEIQSHQRAEVI